MIPGRTGHTIPGQIHLYHRGNRGTGSLPLANAVINVPLFATNALQGNRFLNLADSTVVSQAPGTTTHALRRWGGLWLADIFLFQDVSATLQLKERTVDLLTQSIAGSTDTTRAVWTRQVRAGVAYRATWRIYDCEAKIIYTNGGTNTTVFDFNVILRAA